MALRHDDLVGVNGGGIYRVDGVTGARELITSVIRGSDIAVAYGGHEIYSVSGSSLYAVDPVTGSHRTISSGFATASGVAANRSGDVFVLEHDSSDATGPPRLHRVDPVSGATELLITSDLPSSVAGVPGRWLARDLEMVNDDYVVALGTQGSYARPFGAGLPEGVGAVGFDIALQSEDLLFSTRSLVDDGHLPSVYWATVSGLGVLPGGEIIASSDYNYGAVAVAHDVGTTATGRVGGFGVVSRSNGDRAAVMYNIDITSTASGRVFVAGNALEVFEYEGPDPGGVYEAIAMVCPSCPGGLSYSLEPLADAPFSPGASFSEIQAVVIPEPSTALLVISGLALIAYQRR